MAEYGERAAHNADGTVRVPACTASIHFAESTLQSCQQVRFGLATSEMSEVVGDGGQPEDTRAALPRTLAGQVTGDTCSFGDAAGRRPEGDDDADSGAGADGAQGDGGVGSAEIVPSDP